MEKAPLIDGKHNATSKTPLFKCRDKTDHKKSRDDQLAAYIFMLGSVTFFAITGTLVKTISTPVLVLFWARSVLQMLLAIITYFYLKPENKPKTWKIVWLLMARGLIYCTFLMFYWASLREIPIGDATAILVGVAPVFTGFEAFLCLGESITPAWFSAVLFDCAGVLLIAQPSFMFTHSATDQPMSLNGILYSIIAAFFIGSVAPLTRQKEAKKVNWVYVEFTTHTLSSTLLCPVWFFVAYYNFPRGYGNLVPSDLETYSITGREVLFIILISLCGFCGLCCNTRGYQLGEASKTSLISYLEVPFSYVLQIVVFGDHPNDLGWIGAALLLVTSVSTVIFETCKGKRNNYDYTPIPSAKLQTIMSITDENEGL